MQKRTRASRWNAMKCVKFSCRMCNNKLKTWLRFFFLIENKSLKCVLNEPRFFTENNWMGFGLLLDLHSQLCVIFHSKIPYLISKWMGNRFWNAPLPCSTEQKRKRNEASVVSSVWLFHKWVCKIRLYFKANHAHTHTHELQTNVKTCKNDVKTRTKHHQTTRINENVDRSREKWGRKKAASLCKTFIS